MDVLRAGFPELSWTSVALSARHYAWRAGGNALTLAERVPEAHFDLILASGPVDLAALRGLRPDLAAVRTLLYVHEHEFAYPENPREQGRVDRQLRQILAMLAADRVLTNSRWCADSLVAGAAALLARVPDEVPSSTLESIEQRIEVEPVPLADALFLEDAVPEMRSGPVHLVWNHRHEWDKGVDRLPHLLAALAASGIDFRFHLLGQRFRTAPSALSESLRWLEANPGCRGQIGFVESSIEYRQLLADSDAVLSTALQEFQGLAVMEAVAQGCAPCVPDRLAYRDWVPEAARARSFEADAEADAEALVKCLQVVLGMRDAVVEESRRALDAWRFSRRREAWRARLFSA